MKIRKILILLITLIFSGFLTACKNDFDLCEHEWSEWELMNNATCTQAGEEKRMCLINDNHTQSRIIEPLDHDWGEWILTDQENQIETRICKHDSTHIQRRYLGSRELLEQPVGKNEQVNYNEYHYIVTSSGLWLSENNQEYTVLAYSGTSNTIEIPAYVNNLPITAIGDGAYASPAVVGYIPPVWTKYMFPNNKLITSISFEEGSKLRHIGWVAFQGCTSLVNFETPISLSSIGENAFSNTGLWDKAPNNSIIYAGNWAVGYKGQEKENIEIKDGTVGIASCAFMNTSFKTITIPSSVKIVDNLAFYESQLYSNAANNSLVYADKWVVAYKGNIGAVNIKEGTIGIANGALQYNNSLTSINIPASVESIGSRAFILCKALESVTIAEGLKSLGESAFLYCSVLKTINIPDSLTYLGASAFGSCRALTSIYIPEGIKILNNGLFSECNSLKNFTIPSSVRIIGTGVFHSTALRNIVIPENVISIGAGAFNICTQMQNFSVENGNKFYRSEGNCLIEIATNKLLAGFNNSFIPDNIEHIEKKAFQEMKITSIVIPDSVLTIGEHAFYNCKYLESVTFGKGLSQLDNYVFSNTGIKNLELPSNIKKIGTFAFRECPIESLIIPNSITTLGLGAFYNTAITSLVIESTNLTVEGWGAFAYCEKLTKVLIPASIETIGRLMFWNCTSLTEVIIENGITTIKDGAFTGCSSLSGIIIPKSVLNIESNAFYGSNNLTIYVQTSQKPQGWDENWNFKDIPVIWNYLD